MQFGNITVTFNFLGTTNPEAFAATGGLNLDTFLRVSDGVNEAGLSSDFSAGTSWANLLGQASFTAESAAYTITGLSLAPDASGGFDIQAAPVPEPASWLMALAGLGLVGRLARRRQAASPV